MNAEEAIFAWAERRLGFPMGSVRSVDFGTEQEGYCQTCEYTIGGVEVSWENPKSRKKNKIEYDFISLSSESFSSILEEILEKEL